MLGLQKTGIHIRSIPKVHKSHQKFEAPHNESPLLANEVIRGPSTPGQHDMTNKSTCVLDAYLQDFCARTTRTLVCREPLDEVAHVDATAPHVRPSCVYTLKKRGAHEQACTRFAREQPSKRQGPTLLHGG
jgi:hypothetical protein